MSTKTNNVENVLKKRQEAQAKTYQNKIKGASGRHVRQKK